MGNVAGHVRHLTADVSCTKIFLSITLTNWQPTSSLPTNISNDKTHTKDFLLLQSYRSCFDDIPATYHESADKLHQSERLRFDVLQLTSKNTRTMLQHSNKQLLTNNT